MAMEFGDVKAHRRPVSQGLFIHGGPSGPPRVSAPAPKPQAAPAAPPAFAAPRVPPPMAGAPSMPAAPKEEPSPALMGLQAAGPQPEPMGPSWLGGIPGSVNPNLGRRIPPNAVSMLRALTY